MTPRGRGRLMLGIAGIGRCDGFRRFTILPFIPCFLEHPASSRPFVVIYQPSASRHSSLLCGAHPTLYHSNPVFPRHSAHRHSGGGRSPGTFDNAGLGGFPCRCFCASPLLDSGLRRNLSCKKFAPHWMKLMLSQRSSIIHGKWQRRTEDDVIKGFEPVPESVCPGPGTSISRS